MCSVTIHDNILKFKMIDTTLREGEQFANAFFTTEKKIEIAKTLDEIGVDYLELTSPAASPKSRSDCFTISNLGLKAKVLTHIRCNIDDAQLAIDARVDGVNIAMGTSSYLQEFSHGKSIDQITRQAIDVVAYVRSKGLATRFTAEDTFRSNREDIFNIYKAVEQSGVNRIGIADSVGCADPRQVYDLVTDLRKYVSCDIECHFHNDTGCAIANAYTALEAGATHVDVSVLGIGERNGITPLGGLLAKIYTRNKEYVKRRFDLTKILEIENIVAAAVGATIPFNNCITGNSAFTHKAGIHAKAVLSNPSTYEILNPLDFGLTRRVIIGHRLSGWHGVKSRIVEIGLDLSDSDAKAISMKIKKLADFRSLSIDEVDGLLRTYYQAKQRGDTDNLFFDNKKT